MPADAGAAVRPERTIRRAESAQEFGLARDLFVEYGASLDVDLAFQGFAAEVAGLPGAYIAPRGILLLASVAGNAAGCIALRPLILAHEHRDDLGEIKRLYVRPAARGHAVGAALVAAVVDEARRIGYRELRLDTLATMNTAQAVYRQFGFRPCAPYYSNPLAGVAYLSLAI